MFSIRSFLERISLPGFLKRTHPQTSQSTAFLNRISREPEKQAVLEAINEAGDTPWGYRLKKHLQAFAQGYDSFAATGSTPQAAYVAMRELFYLTNGQFNRSVSTSISRALPPLRVPATEDVVFGDRISDVVQGLQTKGYWVFSEQLEAGAIKGLLDLATTAKAWIRPATGSPSESAVYPEMHALSHRIYDFDETLLARAAASWDVAVRSEFVSVARAYLNCEPILDLVAMWWSFSGKDTKQELSSAAQLYHFDMDRIRFIKFFVYLTDVNELNGPHSYIEGSQLDLRSKSLMRDGRFGDREVLRHFPTEERRILGKKGTIFVADTSGLHKGVPVAQGERLIFQLEFSNSLFGAPYLSPQLDRAAKPHEVERAANLAKFRFKNQD